MRTQEFRFQTSPFSRSTRFPFTSTPSPPAPLAIRKAPSGRRRKSRRQSHKFFKHLLRRKNRCNPTIFFSTDATPSHSSLKNLILNSKKSPGSTQEVSESENRPATRGTAHSEV